MNFKRRRFFVFAGIPIPVLVALLMSAAGDSSFSNLRDRRPSQPLFSSAGLVAEKDTENALVKLSIFTPQTPGRRGRLPKFALPLKRTMVSQVCLPGDYFHRNANSANLDQVQLVGDPSTYFAPGPGATSRSFTNKLQDFLTPEDFGAVADGGVTDNTVAIQNAINAASTLGRILYLAPRVYGVAGLPLVTHSNVVILGHGATLKATAAAAANDPVLKVSGILSGIQIRGLTFDANGVRRFGLDISDGNVANWTLEDVDAMNFTDQFGRGIYSSGFLANRDARRGRTVKLHRTTPLMRVNGVNLAATAGNLPAGTYAVGVAAVDALGNEGPLWPETVIPPITLGPNGGIIVSWSPSTPGSRSYRVYIRDTANTSLGGSYTHYFPVAGAASSFSIRSLPAGPPSALRVINRAGTFDGDLNEGYAFRVSAYFSRAVTNHTGNMSVGAKTWVQATGQTATLSWAAVAGALGYRLHISHRRSGGSREFYSEIDVGNVTSFTYTGQSTTYGRPYGNSDEQVSDAIEGSNVRTWGDQKNILAADTQIRGPIGGGDATLQFVAEMTTGSAPVVGPTWRKIPNGGGTETEVWRHVMMDPQPSDVLRLRYMPLGVDAIILDGANKKMSVGFGLALGRTDPTYGALVAIDAALGNTFAITVPDSRPFTIANPTHSTTGQIITVMVRNTSGSALGMVTWDTAYKLAAWISPENSNSRSISFLYDGSNWVEVGRTPVDVPN